MSPRWFGASREDVETRGPVSLAETVAAVAGHYAGADPVVDEETARNADVWFTWPVEPRTFGEAVAAAERFSDSEAVLATAPPWSRRVDEALHGMDAADPAGMDAWMQVHADSPTPHLYEARLVAAWETRAAEGAAAETEAAQDVDEFADGW